MQNPPILITAFYELDLAKTTPNSYKAKRGVRDYLDFFSFFAGLKNMIVVYTGSEIENEILAMRKAQNLGDKTLVIKKPLSDFAPKEREIIEKTFAHYNQAIGRFDPTHPPHTSAKYDYLMYLKSFFAVDYISNHISNGGGDYGAESSKNQNFIWFDFGFNFNGAYFTDKAQFSFALQPDSAILESLKNDKIHLFSLGKIDSNHLPHILLNGTEHFLVGNIWAGNANAWRKFNARMKEALHTFASFQIMDDDQKMYLWVARNYPNECAIYEIDGWFSVLFYFIPAHLREKIKVASPSILQKEKLVVENLADKIAYPAPLKAPNCDKTNAPKSYLQNLRDEFREFKAKMRVARKQGKRVIKAVFGK